MATISTTLPSDGQTIDASDVNTPINAILAEFNGNIDDNNIKTGANINGAKLLAGSIPGTAFDTTLAGGWLDLADVPDTVTYNGNRSYSLVFNSNDLTDTVSEGMRLRLTRTVSAPTQCADLESGSSQYFSKTSPNKLTFTDDYTVMGWTPALESYAAMGIIARRNADTEGWSLGLNSSGQVVAWSGRIAGNNSSTTSYQSVPLGKATHIAATTDLSGTSVLIYIDGVLVPSLTTITGTITALVQGTTALVVGAEKSAGTNPFDGKLCQVAVFNAVLSAATIRSYASQGLSGSETNLLSAYSLSNSIADLNTTTPNDLTAQGSAVATSVDSPFGNHLGGTLEYAIITAKAFSTNTTLTVQVPEGCAIPTSGGVSAVAYSTQDIPYLFPRAKGRWSVESLYQTAMAGSTTANTYGQFVGTQLTVPVGNWNLGFNVDVTATKSTASQLDGYLALSTSTSTVSDTELYRNWGNNDVFITRGTVFASRLRAISSATPYYLIGKVIQATISSHSISGNSTSSFITAECAYL